MVGIHNLKVAIMDSDFYALQAIYSYLAWDRRTRVVLTALTPDELTQQLGEAAGAECPDVTLFEVDWTQDMAVLRDTLNALGDSAGVVLCMSSHADAAHMLTAITETGARGYLVKGDVRLGIAGAVVYAIYQEFIVSQAVIEALGKQLHQVLPNASPLPERRRYPELTDRVEQALRLCVIEGMSAELAADEMGVSPHTIRSYIKEGYRIMESQDATDYPTEMSPQERAFMRYTALQNLFDED